MKAATLASLLSVAGCAHAPAIATRPVPRIADTPQLVVNPPPRTLYRYVGRVEGVRMSGESSASGAPAFTWSATRD